MKIEEKIQILIDTGFIQYQNQKEYELKLEKGKDRFLTTIFYNSESNTFYYARFKTGGYREVSKKDIMKNFNKLHTSAKNHFIRIEEILNKSGIILP